MPHRTQEMNWLLQGFWLLFPTVFSSETILTEAHCSSVRDTLKGGCGISFLTDTEKQRRDVCSERFSHTSSWGCKYSLIFYNHWFCFYKMSFPGAVKIIFASSPLLWNIWPNGMKWGFYDERVFALLCHMVVDSKHTYHMVGEGERRLYFKHTVQGNMK